MTTLPRRSPKQPRYTEDDIARAIEALEDRPRIPKKTPASASADGYEGEISADGSFAYFYRNGTWKRAALAAMDLSLRSLLFTPGGDGTVSFYRVDATHAQNPRTALISSIASDVITLTTSVAATFFQNTFMAGVSYIRIWNTTKNPDEQAWVKAQPATNQLQVLSAASIAGWSNGDTIEVGDPTGVTPGRVMALDISPMMQALFGRVFRQSGLLAKLSCANIGAASAEITLTENGATGSFTGVKANAFDGTNLPGQATIPCSVLSPVSDTNLVFVRETVTGANMGISLASSIGLWV